VRKAAHWAVPKAVSTAAAMVGNSGRRWAENLDVPLVVYSVSLRAVNLAHRKAAQMAVQMADRSVAATVVPSVALMVASWDYTMAGELAGVMADCSAQCSVA
jgi:hypothetical protein